MQTTEHLNLNLPEATDPYDIGNENENMEILDSAIYNHGIILGSASTAGHNKIINDLSKTSLSNGEALSARMGNALGQMFAPIESSSTASRAYAIGAQFIYNGILYKATAAISQGGNINPGGNCTPASSVTSQISDLNNNIGTVSNQMNSVKESGSLKDIIRTGIYYITSQVTDLPGNGGGGMYIYRAWNEQSGIGVGIFFPLYSSIGDFYIYERNESSENYNFTGVHTCSYQKISEETFTRTTTSTGAISLYGLLPAGSGIIGLNYSDNHIGIIYQRDQSYLTCLSAAMQPVANESVTFTVRYYRNL